MTEEFFKEAMKHIDTKQADLLMYLARKQGLETPIKDAPTLRTPQ